MFKEGDRVKAVKPMTPLLELGEEYEVTEVSATLEKTYIYVDGNSAVCYSPNCFELVVREETDPYAELKAAYAEGKTIEMCFENGTGWSRISNPHFDFPPEKYRIKPEPELVPHKHAELIKQWADGRVVQYRYNNEDGKWRDATTPKWDLNAEYRIKPSVTELRIVELLEKRKTLSEQKTNLLNELLKVNTELSQLQSK